MPLCEFPLKISFPRVGAEPHKKRASELGGRRICLTGGAAFLSKGQVPCPKLGRLDWDP